jgi:hypothetical protein
MGTSVEKGQVLKDGSRNLKKAQVGVLFYE